MTSETPDAELYVVPQSLRWRLTPSGDLQVDSAAETALAVPGDLVPLLLLFASPRTVDDAFAQASTDWEMERGELDRLVGAWIGSGLLSRAQRQDDNGLDRLSRNDVVQCSVRGLAIRLRSANSWERFRIETYESKEPETLDWIDEHFAAGDTLYDVGANVGVYSVYAALKNPQGRVFAFEPSAHNCAALLENAQLNGLTNLAACCFPLSAGRTFGWFHLSTIMAGSSMHAFDREDLMNGFGESSVMAQGGVSTSLDELLSEGFPPPSLIKIDVDGLEPDILRGARGTLQGPSLRSVLVEINWQGDTPTRETVELVEAAGFRLAAVGDVSQRNEMKWQNYIFVRTGR